MSETLTTTRTRGSLPAASNELHHIYCCDPDISLCRLDISELPFGDIEDDLCVVCRDLEEEACERCGWRP